MYSERSKDKAKRVPVVSFSIKDRVSKKVVEQVDAMSDFGIRWGHFYSKRLVNEVLGLGEEGVVRVSMVHYNTGMSLFLISFTAAFTVVRRYVVWVGTGISKEKADVVVCRGGDKRPCGGAEESVGLISRQPSANISQSIHLF